MNAFILFATLLTLGFTTADAQCIGTFTSDRNKDSTFSGTWNRACFLGNKDVEVNVEGSSSDIEMIDSKDVKVNIEDSTVKLYEQKNTDISAKASNVHMESDKNADIKTDRAWCMFKNNKNIKYNGRGGNNFLSKFMDNKNIDVEGNDNNIIASDNKNLKISGDNNRLEMSNTLNHNIRPASHSTNGNIFAVTSGGIHSFNFELQYVGEAKIRGGSYELGIFEFDITKDSDNGVINVTNVRNPYSITDNNSSNKIVIQTEKDGNVQTLELSGDRVEELYSNSFNIYINTE